MPARRKSNVYTRTGDRGRTGLFGGARVSKSHLRVVAYGGVDELNATLGLAVSFIRQRAVAAILERIQNELFNIGAELANGSPVRRSKGASATFRLQRDSVGWIESTIDDYDARLPPLNTFILPGGSQEAAALHVARTVCRRAERDIIALNAREKINPVILIYINRLSDLLFVLARYLNKAAGKRDATWEKKG